LWTKWRGDKTHSNLYRTVVDWQSYPGVITRYKSTFAERVCGAAGTTGPARARRAPSGPPFLRRGPRRVLAKRKATFRAGFRVRCTDLTREIASTTGTHYLPAAITTDRTRAIDLRSPRIVKRASAKTSRPSELVEERDTVQFNSIDNLRPILQPNSDIAWIYVEVRGPSFIRETNVRMLQVIYSNVKSLKIARHIRFEMCVSKLDSRISGTIKLNVCEWERSSIFLEINNKKYLCQVIIKKCYLFLSFSLSLSIFVHPIFERTRSFVIVATTDVQGRWNFLKTFFYGKTLSLFASRFTR